MRSIVAALLVLASFLAPGSLLRGRDAGDSLPAPLGRRISDFTLRRAENGKPWSLAREGRGARAVVVLFLGTECPINNQYVPTLAALHPVYQTREVVFVGINSNLHDSAAAIDNHARAFGIPFPMLKDDDGTVAERFGAGRVPEAFVLDGDRIVRYRGRIDDQLGRGSKRPRPTRRDLVEALEAVLAGHAVAQPVTEVIGCPISRPARARKPASTGEAITYSQHVARILQNHCQECHRPGEIGPFSLLTYQGATAWAEAIREAVTEGRMPPWNADPAHGTFANDRRLSDAERQALLTWIDQGCAEGDPAFLPPLRHFVQGWSIGRPDAIIAMNREFHVPAQSPRGGIPYKYLVAGKPFTEEKWVQAVEVRPGNRAVVHHVIAYVVPPGKLPLLSGDEVTGALARELHDGDASDPDGPRSLASFVPGDQAQAYPEGLAKRIPQGSQLVFEVHYTPNGKACDDRTAVGLIYARERPRYEVLEGDALNYQFTIPPGAANHRVTASTKLEKDIVLLSLSPHMHLRGKSFAFHVTLPDGRKDVLLSVPRYDFSWQLGYILAEPRRLPKGSTIECIAHFDNSPGNPNNPDPSATVRWGDQTWDEMMLGYFEYHDAKPRDGR
jgi:mono/diheme cytochrome c family protein/peroxiredoxin